MNKKGLTLVELLAVVVIISLIAAILFPMVNGLLKDSRNKTKTADESSVVEAAKMYIADNPDLVDDNAYVDSTSSYLGTVSVTIGTLIDEGYLDIDEDKYKDNSKVDIVIRRSDAASTDYYYEYNVSLNAN